LLIARLAAVVQKRNAHKRCNAQQERRKAKDIQHQKAQLTPHFSPPCGTPVKFGLLVSGLAAVVQKRNAHKRCNAKQERRKAKDIYKQQNCLTANFSPPLETPVKVIGISFTAFKEKVNAYKRCNAQQERR
jgi:uncharacterized membrane protein